MRFLTGILLLLSVIAGCGRSVEPSPETSSANESLRVVVTSQPLLEMAQAVGQGSCEIIRIVPDDVSSRDWKPAAADVQTLQHAKLILISGAGYEPWRDRVSLPGSRLKDTAAGYYEQFIRIPDAVTHQHGPEGPHSHPGTVWATWIDPDLAISQLSQVTGSLIRIAPESKTAIETAAAKLKSQFESLNPLIVAVTSSAKQDELIVVSDGPCYQYLLNRLGWKLNYLHWAESGDLSDRDREELATVVGALPKSKHRLFLMNTRRSAAAEELAREAGFTVVRIDLCEFPVFPAVPLVERMRASLERLKSAIEGFSACETPVESLP